MGSSSVVGNLYTLFLSGDVCVVHSIATQISNLSRRQAGKVPNPNDKFRTIKQLFDTFNLLPVLLRFYF